MGPDGPGDRETVTSERGFAVVWRRRTTEAPIPVNQLEKKVSRCRRRNEEIMSY